MKGKWFGWLLVLLAAAFIRPASAGELRAGVGRAEITPPVGTPLGGYAARTGAASTGVHDPIMAKALVLDDGETRLAILTTDLVGTTPDMVRGVAQGADFPAERLMICASHTHSGPGAFGKGPFATIVLGPYNAKVLDHLVAGMTRALKQALDAVQPAKLAIGEKPAPQLMRNRRKSPVTDPALWMLRVDTRDGKPLAALVNLTAHGTVLGDDNLEFSADWMGFTQAFLEQKVSGLTALYSNGAEGDISPNIPDHSSTFDGARAHGEKCGEAALELYRSLRPSEEVKLGYKTASLDLPQTFSAALLGAGKQTVLQYFSINQAALIAAPGELIAQLGLLLKDHARRQGYAHPAIMGLANDHLGYFLTRAEMKKGGYEAKVSFFGDRFGEDLILALARLVGGDAAPLKEAIEQADRTGTDG